jgi:hypothetical protein
MTLPHPTAHLDRSAAERLYTKLAATAAARATQQRRRRRTARLCLLAGASAVALFAGLAVARSLEGTGSDRLQTAAPAREPAPAPPPTLNAAGGSGPLLGLAPKGHRWKPRLDTFGNDFGRAVSLPEARRLAGFPVATPHSPLARDTMIRKVWFVALSDQTPQNAVALEYPHLEIIQQQMPDTYNAAHIYRAMARQRSDPGGTTRIVNGLLAYVAPPYTDTHGIQHPGYVDFTKNHVQTQLEAYYTADQLIAIAETLN